MSQIDRDDAAHESLPTRGGWIEISLFANSPAMLPSLPTRGGWIEIPGRGW